MTIELYINNTPVDIDRNTTFPITFQSTDLSNPAAVQNSWSKTVSIPATEANNDLFNHIWRLDHQVLNFNPRQRVSFTLAQDGAIIEQGYIKLNSIDYYASYPKTYNITLFGGLGEFFYSISEKDMNELSLDYTHTINRKTILDTWNQTLPPWSYALTYSGLYDNFDSGKVYNEFVDTGISDFILDTIEVDGTFYNLVDGGIITFTPGDENGTVINTSLPSGVNRIRYDDSANRFLVFSNAGGIVYYTNGKELGEFAPIKVSNSQVRDLIVTNSSNSNYRYMFLQNTGGVFYGDSLASMASINNGTNFWQLNNVAGVNAGLYNGKYSKPTTSTSSIMAYGLAENGSTDVNYAYAIRPEFGDFFSLGSTLEMHTSGTIAGQFIVTTARYIYTTRDSSTGFSRFSPPNITGDIVDVCFSGYDSSESYPWEAVAITNTNQKIACIATIGGIQAVTTITDPNIGGGYATIAFSDTEQILQIGANPLTPAGGDTYLRYGPNGIFDYTGWNTISGFYEPIDTEENDYNEYQRNEYRSYYQRPMLRVRNLFEQILIDSDYSYTLDSGFFNYSNHYWNETYVIMDRLKVPDEQVEDNKVGNIRSDDEVTFEMMIGSGINQLEFLLSYCMMFGILVIQNKNDKSLRFIQRADYFKEHKILDWTEKIDYSRNTSLNPLTFNFKTGIIKHKDAGSKYEDRYKEAFTREYGSLRFDTGYEFSNNENTFLETIFQNTVYSREYSPEFEGRYTDASGNILDVYADDKILPALFTTSGDQMSYNESSYHLVFWNGMQTVKTINLSDDNQRMLEISLFMWTDASGDTTATSQIPNITALWPGSGAATNSLYFARPAKQYYTGGPTYPEEIDIYDVYHKAYYEELYNENNKVLTAYFYLNNIDINNFEFNRFVVIDNSLWFVNKIIDFDIANESSTKVELIRVTDLAAYGATQSEGVPPV